ncbi:MAG: hypothetical protein HC774_01585 [Sphingomonadales bacterium]|nr:hypothetical protein [Sphingomonadales bacterium]
MTGACPHSMNKSFKPEYTDIRWEYNQDHFRAWTEGKTGYPIVDAAMRQLYHTGYMHNRLRMVVASFLTKDLGIDWRRGEAYFALHLNDFDLAANNGGWQWAASSGCDAQPYFRIFNPVNQSEKFDAQGKFIRRYLPQIGKDKDKLAEIIGGYGFLACFFAGVAVRSVERGHAYHGVLHTFSHNLEIALMALILVLLGGTLPSLLGQADWRHLAVVALLMLAIRPIAGYLSLIGSRQQHRGAVAFLGIRGIGSIFYLAFGIGMADFENAADLWIVMALAVAASTILHGFTASRMMARVDRLLSRHRAAD